MTCGLSVTSVRRIGGLAFAVVSMVAVPRPAMAQDRQASQTVAELRQRLDEIERTMQAQVAALRQQIADLEGRPTLASNQAAARQVGSSPVVSASAQEATFSRDRESVARVNNQPIDPALQGFLAIPGTPARLKFDGYAKLDTIVDTKPAGNADTFVPSWG